MATKKKKSSSIFSSLRRIVGNPTYGRRDFERNVKKLVKQGLYVPSVPIESLQPGRYVNSLIKKFADVLQGTAQAIQVNPGEVKKYKEQGIRTRNGRAIVEVPKGATARRIRAENGVPRYEVKLRTKRGVQTQVREIVPVWDLEAHIVRKVNNAPPLQQNQFIGVRFYGNNSAKYFREKDLLLAWLIEYKSVQFAATHGSPEDQQEYYQNLEVITFYDEKKWNKEYNDRQEARKKSKTHAAQQRYRERQKQRYAEMDELEKRMYRERRYTDRAERAERERARRAQLKHDDPSAYARMLEENAARVRASRARRKQK
jgi:hypothetical protein